jgi:hypothetical protein
MTSQLAEICAHGLLQPEELARFTPATRGMIESLSMLKR